MAKLTFDKVISQFTKVMDNLDKVVKINQEEVNTYNNMISSMEDKKKSCQVEVDKASKVKQKLSEFLEV